MTLRTITIALIRAEDIPDGAYVRRPITAFSSSTKSWQWVYSVTVGGRAPHDEDADTATVAKKLDERYVVMRLSDDPPLMVPNTRRAGVTTYDVDRFGGAPGDYDDDLVIARAYDLWEIQVPVDSKESTS